MPEFLWFCRPLLTIPSFLQYYRLPSSTHFFGWDLFSNIINYSEYHQFNQRLWGLLKYYQLAQVSTKLLGKRIITKYILPQHDRFWSFDTQRRRRSGQVEMPHKSCPITNQQRAYMSNTLGRQGGFNPYIMHVRDKEKRIIISLF